MSANRSIIRVCFLVGGREGGGSAHSVLRLIRRIDRADFDVTVAACEDGPFTARLRDAGLACHVLGTGWPPPLRANTAQGTQTRWFGYPLLLQWFVRTVDRVIRETRRTRIDVIHSNYYHFHVVAALAGLFTGRRYVWHWRGQLEQPDHEGLDRQPVSASSRLSLRWSIVRRLGAVSRHALGRRGWSIAVSEATLRSVRPFVGTQYAVIYNGVPLEGKSPASGAIRKLLLLERAARIVGMVASFNPRKGHHVFLEAAAEVCAAEPVAHFVHIGGQTAAGQQQYRQRLIDRTHELHLEHRVHWMGHQDNVAELFADMEIAVLCTLPPGEGLPLTILEAMAQGVPVVASDCGPSREIITHDVSGLLVEPGNPRALAAAIRKLLLDEEARRRMGEAGQRLCRERFDIQQTVRRVEDVYRRIVDSTTKRQQWAPLR